MRYDEMEYILRNVRYFRSVVNLNFQTTSNYSENLNVQNNSYGNTTENSIIKKMNNKEYIEALAIVKSIDYFLENGSNMEKRLFHYKYVDGFSIPRIARSICYSESSVKRKLKNIKQKIYRKIKSELNDTFGLV